VNTWENTTAETIKLIRQGSWLHFARSGQQMAESEDSRQQAKKSKNETNFKQKNRRLWPVPVKSLQCKATAC